MKFTFFYTILVSLLLSASLLSCLPESNNPILIPDPEPVDTVQTEPVHFLALGDSYTIGESVAVSKRWPVQLRDSLLGQGISMENPRIIAQTGWTTNDLIRAIESSSDLRGTYDLVSLLIGVNNQYRGYDFSQYETEFPILLQKALDLAGGSSDRVIVVSIPDYGTTPFGASGNPEKIARELDAYNAIAKEQAEAKGVKFFNITPISREATDKPELVAGDGLHPSAIMYARWVELMRKDVQRELTE